METKVLQVFYGKDCLPYKDKERSVHFPIVGAAIQGASNTTKIRFYFDELVEEDDQTTTWVVVSKLPNGKIGSEIVETSLDSELNEHYALFNLKNFYTQAKGDLFLSLQGYQGGVQVETDPSTGISQIVGTPTIQATGSIKLAINYATQLVGSGETANINFQKILADLGTKLGIRAYTERVTELPTTGQTNVFYAIYDDPNNPNKLNIYVWNGTTQSYVWVGDNTLYLGDYYTREEGEQFEQEINERVSDVEDELSVVGSGAPRGAYDTFSDLVTADPDHNYIYLVTANGYWYYWSSQYNTWLDGGPYLSTGQAVPNTRKIAGLQLNADISDTELVNALENANDTKYGLSSSVTDNLYGKSLLINSKSIDYDGELFDYANSIVSGFFKVEEGKTYIIKNGRFYTGYIIFYDKDKEELYSTSVNGYTWGNMPLPTGKATVSGTSSETIVTINNDSEIAYIMWFISSEETITSNNDNSHTIFGEHTLDDFNEVQDTIQVNYGSTILDYIPGAIGLRGLGQFVSGIYKNTHYISSNLYNKKIGLNGYLVSYEPSNNYDEYANGILSNKINVVAGKKYVISCGDNFIGAIFFYSDAQPICAMNIDGGNYGEWTGIAGKVSISGDQKVRYLDIDVASGITKICFYITSTNESNYFGSHTQTDFNNAISQVQVNEGTLLMPYEPFNATLLERVGNNFKRIKQIENENYNEHIRKKLVHLVKNENDFTIRSSFNDENDILINCSLYGSNNGAFNFDKYQTINKDADLLTTNGTVFKQAGDDIAPIYVGESYRGGNHGDYNVYELEFSTAHELTESNIGQIWNDANNIGYLILKIASSTKIIVAHYDTTTELFVATAPITSISYNGTTIAFNSATRVQLYPSINRKSVKLYDDKGFEIIENGLYSGKYFVVEEKYTIIHPKGIYLYLTSNVGDNTNSSYYSDAIGGIFCNVSIIYKFTEQGVVTQSQVYEILNDNEYIIMCVQSEKKGDYISVPLSTKKLIEEFDGSNYLNFVSSTWLDANNPPYLFFQGNSNMSNGIAIGYHPLIGAAKSSIRKHIDNACQINTSQKVYPNIHKGSILHDGDFVECLAVRLPYSYSDNDVPMVSWYYVNDDVYLILNIQKTVDKYINLPAYLNGLKTTLISSDGNITIPLEYTTSQGIKVKTTNYGYALLKLSKN